MTGLATPSQTIGPFFSFGFAWLETTELAPAGDDDAVLIVGQVFDGDGIGVPDAVLEVYQADGDGRFGPDTEPSWGGFGRILTSATGAYEFSTVKPGRVHSADGNLAAPHIDVSVFARGLLQRVITRIYFPDESAANGADHVFSGVDPARRATLVAHPQGAGLRFDIHLQGDTETVFFNC
jgi:protocatechuate 3,4-dioxygenase alpha subunit